MSLQPNPNQAFNLLSQPVEASPVRFLTLARTRGLVQKGYEWAGFPNTVLNYGAQLSAKRSIRIMMLGLRGFPGVQGGIETHAEHLCPLLIAHGCEVEVIVRSPYQPVTNNNYWRGVTFKPLWAPKTKGLEAIVHTFIGVLYAAIRRPDVLHIHAIGPSIMTPLARLLGLRVVVTHHGPDYERQKWGMFAKYTLKMGERLGMYFANERIVVSDVIRKRVKQSYAVDATVIPNGVSLVDLPKTTGALHEFGLQPGKYVLLVSRLVPEKRHHDLINAFIMSGLKDWKLALVGASDHPDAYMQSILNAAIDLPNIVCTGFQTGLALQELYTHAGLFVLPSSHEGLPIALLEALSYGLPVIASDIPANLEVGLLSERHFRLGDQHQLAERIRYFADLANDTEAHAERRRWVANKYNWQDIAYKTARVYQSIFTKTEVKKEFAS